MQADKELENWLSTLQMETPSSNLAERIIAAAAVTPQHAQTAGFWERLSWLLPRPVMAPALVLASVLCVSFITGYSTTSNDEKNSNPFELWDEDQAL